MSKRTIDSNGWLEVDGNPIAKAGVFPYLGREINAPNANQIYYVLRSPEELQDPDTINSFKLIPFVDDHEMLGENATPAERKGIQGVVGERVYYDEPYLKANIRILSDSIRSTIDSRKKIELSPGYRSKYDFTPGIWNGQRYDAKQHTIRANHLALVHSGRSGADVSVQDHSIFTIDTAELVNMTLEQILAAIAAMSDEDKAAVRAALSSDSPDTTDADGEMSDEERAAAAGAAEALEVAAEAAAEAAVAASEAAATGNPDDAEEAEVAAAEASEAADVAEEELESIDTTDAKALLKEVKRLSKVVATMDTGKILRSIGRRDALATKVSRFVGTFDHASMTEQQVAEYSVKKLGIKCPKGHEAIAVSAWMQGRTPESQQPSTATMDSRLNSPRAGQATLNKLYGDK